MERVSRRQWALQYHLKIAKHQGIQGGGAWGEGGDGKERGGREGGREGGRGGGEGEKE